MARVLLLPQPRPAALRRPGPSLSRANIRADARDDFIFTQIRAALLDLLDPTLLLAA